MIWILAGISESWVIGADKSANNKIYHVIEQATQVSTGYKQNLEFITIATYLNYVMISQPKISGALFFSDQFSFHVLTSIFRLTPDVRDANCRNHFMHNEEDHTDFMGLVLDLEKVPNHSSPIV